MQEIKGRMISMTALAVVVAVGVFAAGEGRRCTPAGPSGRYDQIIADALDGKYAKPK